MKTEQEMQAEHDALESELYRIKKARRQAENAAMVGKCFKYHNSIGMDSPRFWLYSIVTGAGEHFPTAMSFQARPDGLLEIKTADYHHSSEGNIEIPRREFDAAWRAFTSSVSELHTTE